MIYSALMILLFLIIMPFLVGSLFVWKVREGQGSVALSYAFGFVTIFALFQFIVVGFMHSYPYMRVVWPLMLAVLTGLCVLSVIVHNRRLFLMLKEFFAKLKTLPWVFWIAVGLIVFQTLILTLFVHEDADDAFYVTSVNDLVNLQNTSMFRVNVYSGMNDGTGGMRYFYSMYEVCIAFFCILTDIHPAIFMHTLMPLLMIPFAYLIYYLIGRELFADDLKKVGLFLVILSIVNLFGNQSVYTVSSFLLFRIWQGKAILASIVLPIIFLLSIRAMRNDGNFWDYLMLLFAMGAACCVTSMGTVLGLIVLWCMAIVFAIAKKKAKLLAYATICSAPNVIFALMTLLG